MQIRFVLSLLLAALMVGLTASAGGGSDGSKARAELSGDQEVPPVETETRGRLQVRFDDAASVAGFKLKVRDGVAITQAHLHCAVEGENGPVVAFLSGFIPGGFDVNHKLARARLTDANITAVGADCVPSIGVEITNIAELLDAIRDGNVYVNVHSVANPGGEVRGQLRLKDEDGDSDSDDLDRHSELEEFLFNLRHRR